MKCKVGYFFVIVVVFTSCASSGKYAKNRSSQGYKAASTNHKPASRTSPSKTVTVSDEVIEFDEKEVPADENRRKYTTVDIVISSARSFIGTPYKWGGTSRSGMDCSGLLCYAFESVDYTLPRTSAAQSEVGKKVRRTELQPGDLLFFATGRSRKQVSHVGMVTDIRDGEVWFIHSSSSLGVIESKLSTSYYSTRYLWARRPL